MIPVIFVLFSFFVLVKSGCDNGCSGHGQCGTHGVCECYDNWGLGLSHLSGDCSERICPFEIAWVDTPNKLGAHHRYAECANRGICNRETGECECFPGYEGKGCQRTTCPNDCSGHGRCTYIQNLPYAAVAADFVDDYYNFQTAYTFADSYYEWDKGKTRGCICDPEYGDVDCSKRMCQYGTDVMDLREDLTTPAKYQVQRFIFQIARQGQLTDLGSTQTFALTFKSKLNETFTTQPINIYSGDSDFRRFLLNIRDALLRLPNRVIDKVEVEGYHTDYDNLAYVNVTFTGDYVQGPQNLLTVRSYYCNDGCSPKLTGVLNLSPVNQTISQIQMSDFNSYECGRRGKCDYETGICQCFDGYSGPTCSIISCLV